MAVATMRRWINRGSPHFEPKPNFEGNYKDTDNRLRRIGQGEVIEDARNLDKIFPGKFELIVEGVGQLIVTEARRAAVLQLIEAGGWNPDDRVFLESLTDDGFDRIAKNSAARNPQVQKITSTLGEDVTHGFQRAYDEQFLVFRNAAGKHQVTKREAPTKPLNKAPLDKEGVEPFVAKFLAEK